MRFYTLDSMRSKVAVAVANGDRAVLTHESAFTTTDLHFRRGYAEALEQVKRLADAMLAELPDLPKPKTRYEVSGARLDVARAAAGVPECFRRTVRQRQAPKTYTIACNRTYGGKTTSESVYNRGVMMAAFTQYVERQLNVRVGITLLRYIAQHGPTRSYEIEVKRPEHPLDLNTIATTVCDHSFLDGIIFACSGMDYPGQKYGDPCDPPEEITRKYDLYIPSNNQYDFSTWESTFEFLKTRIAMLRADITGIVYDPSTDTGRSLLGGAHKDAPTDTPRTPPVAPPTPTKPATRVPISARYTGKCGTCHKVIHKGDQCDWDKVTRLIHHTTC